MPKKPPRAYDGASTRSPEVPMPPAARMSSGLPVPEFLFTTCQRGSEALLKGEMARLWPHMRPAFSRPGFVTFKLAEGHALPVDFDPGVVFARSWGFSLGRVEGPDLAARTAGVWQTAQVFREAGVTLDRLDVFPRLTWSRAGDDEWAWAVECQHIHAALVAQAQAAGEPLAPQAGVEPLVGQWVLDVVLVDPELWFVGYHRHSRAHLPWPGGMSTQKLPPHAVSRAYLKMDQALRWSRLPVQRGEQAFELGSSPGGAAQALLDRGLHVTGIDPATMHRDVLAHPDFVHIQRRTPAVPRKDYRKCRWLMADMNVAPEYTLDAAEAIVTLPDIRVRGMILTLKLGRPELAEHVDQYLDRVRSWGFGPVFARQMQHHRQEIAVAAWHPALKQARRSQASASQAETSDAD